jgi:ribosomal protein S18 acetylase RimI-like enzyme
MADNKHGYRFDSLSAVNLQEIAATFSQSFSKYFIPMNITPAVLAEKIKVENINLELSAGCFEDQRLVGFILTGTGSIKGHLYAYNAGTGVLSEHRGKNLAKQMYQFLIEKLRQAGIRHHVLEVIKENMAALKVYNELGFAVCRVFYCYKGKFFPGPIPDGIGFCDLVYNDILSFIDQLDFLPTWQNTTVAIQRAGYYKLVGCTFNQQLAGYIVFDPNSGKVRQFAVNRKVRQQGVGKALFTHAQSLMGDKEMVITYVETGNAAANAFLEKNGLKIFLNAYELEAVF